MYFLRWPFSLCVLLCASSGYSEESDWLNRQTTNIQLLRGHEFELGSQNRTIVTLEHASDWKYGDIYAFLDQTLPDNGQSSFYGEFFPRLSFNKITGHNISYGPITDVLLAGMIEKPEHSRARFLYGLSLNLDIPTFAFFKSSLFVRDNPDLDKTYQVTLQWKKPFHIGAGKFVLEGFADFVGDEGAGRVANQLVVPRFLFDLGHNQGYSENKLLAGIEWQYWRNKFGLDNVNESVPQLQLKYVF